MAKVVPLKPGQGVNASQQLASMQNILRSNGEVNPDLDNSLIDLDYEKNLTTIDTEKMLQARKEHHATKANGNYYKCADVCCDFEPGSHYCISSSEKSDLTKFGVGILLYFKYIKHLIFFFFLFILLSVPALVFSIASFQTYNTKSGDLSYLDLLTATTIGSIGLGAASCGLGKLSAYAKSGSTENQIYFECPAGKIADASNIIYGIVDTGSTCAFFEESDLNTDCNYYDSTVISSTFSSCVGAESCTISIPNGMFTSSTDCDSLYQSKYIYIQVSCETTTLTLFDGLEIEKTTVAYTVAILDTVIIIVFLLMVYSMKYAQKSAAKNVLKKAYSASSYTVQIRNLPQDMPSEELASKLWTFLDIKLGNKTAYTNHRVVDVQIVLPNRLIAFSRKFGDVIREKNTLMREFVQLYAPGYPGHQIDFAGVKALLLQLKEKQSPNLREATSLFKQIREKASQKARLLTNIQKLRTSKDIKIVCAFVTFSSVPARNRILDKFSSSSCERFLRMLCSCCYTKDLSFQGKLIYARSADDPSSILWENLGEPGLAIFFRRMSSFFLTIAMWVISGGILLVSTYYKNYFKSEYPTIDCTGVDPTKAQVSADYSQGSLQTGLLECYCSQDIIGRLNDVFPASNNAQLCQTWFKDKVVMLSITFAIVFGVIIVNFAIQFIFQGLSKFEKHSTLNKQLAQRVLKTFVAQFLNTGILILLINAKIKDISFWQGKFSDISPLWYENVGSTLLSTMFINIFTIPALKLVGVFFNKMAALCDRSCTSDIRKTKKKTQPAYEKVYLGPEFIIDFRYSQMLTLTFVCFLYSGGMPFLYVTSFLQLVITYYFDKLFLLRICRLPKNYDERLEQVVRITMYGVIVLHLAFTIFMYGNAKIFNQELSSFSALTTTVGSIGDTISSNSKNVVLRWLNRCKISHNLPLVIVLVVVVVVFFVKGFLISFLRKTLFAAFIKEEDANRKQIKKKNGKSESTYTFFSVIKSEDIATLIRLTKVTLKTTQNENLVALLKKKLLLLKQQYQVRKQDEDGNQVDPNINFIGFFSYDVRLNPMYKAQFAIEEQLDDEDLN